MIVTTKQKYGPNADREWCHGAQERFVKFTKDKLSDMFVHCEHTEEDDIVTVKTVCGANYDEAKFMGAFAEYPNPEDFATLMNPDVYMTEIYRLWEGPKSM